jgi:hypothetical protein
MRTRLCYLLLIVLPLVVYWPTVFSEYGTPEDMLRLGLPSNEGEGLEPAHKGILHDAFLEISFASVESVAAIKWVRLLAVFLIILTSIAVWQLLERSAWQEIDAAVAAAALALLPAAQLFSGWASAWPALIAGLLSIAGFAAIESELEAGGHKRVIGTIGGLLLYFASAMCFLPSSTMALVPLAGIALVKPFRQWSDTRKWFRLHSLLLLVGITSAWILTRWMMSDAGIVERTTFVERLVALGIRTLPAAWSTFIVGQEIITVIMGLVVAVIVLVVMVRAARRQGETDATAKSRWIYALVGPFILFALVMLVFGQNWRATHLANWALSGVVVVALIAALRVLLVPIPRKQRWHQIVMASVLFAGAVIASTQSYGWLAQPLGSEWDRLHAAVMRSNFAEQTEAVLVLPAGAKDQMPNAGFDQRVASVPAAARQLFAAALQERYPSGLPKGQRVNLEVTTEPPRTDFAGNVFSLRDEK